MSTIVVQKDHTTYVVTGIQGPPGVGGGAGVGGGSINGSTDIDITNLADGSVLVYNTTTNRWQATTTLEKQYFNGGFF